MVLFWKKVNDIVEDAFYKYTGEKQEMLATRDYFLLFERISFCQTID